MTLFTHALRWVWFWIAFVFDPMSPVLICAVIVGLASLLIGIGYESGAREERALCGEEYLDGRICFPTRQP